LAIWLGSCLMTSAIAEERVAVIVHPGREVELNVAETAQIYLRKRRFWSQGEPLIPVNRNADSKVRKLFSRVVFGEQAGRLRTYWNRQYFHGVLPPATLASDQAVRRFVAKEPNAIGYVDAASVDSTVRVVLYLE